jgi:hypothetical protein
MTIHMFRYMHFSEEALGKSFGDLLRNPDLQQL